MNLNNHEIAYLFYFGVLAIFFLFKKELRAASIDLFKAFADPKIFTPIAIGALWTFLIVLGMWKASLWTASNLKETVVWFFAFMLVNMLKVNKFNSGEITIKSLIISLFSLSAIVEFITRSYSFPVIFELIAVPLVVFLGGMLVVAEKRNEKTIVNIITFLLALYVLTCLIYSSYSAYVHSNNFFSISNLRSFLVPILLSLFSIGFFLIFKSYVLMESMLIAIKFSTHGEAYGEAKKIAFILLLKDLNGDKQLVDRWKKYLNRASPCSTKEVRELYEKFLTSISIEQKSHSYEPDTGWNISAAKRFMSEVGIETSTYDYGYDAWHAQSNLIAIDDNLFQNRVAYYLQGDEFSVKKIKLKIYINTPDDADKAELIFNDYSNLLLSKVLKKPIKKSEIPFPYYDEKGVVVSEATSEFTGGIPNGYDKTLTISHGL